MGLGLGKAGWRLRREVICQAARQPAVLPSHQHPSSTLQPHLVSLRPPGSGDTKP